MKKLILIHGRSQENQDAIDLKGKWVASLNGALSTAGMELPIPEPSVRFPYYGDTLDQLSKGLTGDDVAKVIVRGELGDADELKFHLDVLKEIRNGQGITDQKVAEFADAGVVEKGYHSWPWVHATLRAIDKHAPWVSSNSIARFTHDVYVYLTNPAVSAIIDDGVRDAFDEHPSVVVAHSLGSVVAYNLLQREGAERGWKVPLFVTLGSPLGIRTIRERLKLVLGPECVGGWFNARDRRDIVALYPLNPESGWQVDPEITNHEDVLNSTSNRHGIEGYLSDPVVAIRIHEALGF